MSSLIFYVDESQALIATDTLVVDGVDKKPKIFCSKAFYIPHINMIVASTGLAGFSDQWIARINSYLNVGDIEDLSTCAQGMLSEVFEWYNAQLSLSPTDNFTATIYHFGLSSRDGKMKSYAHRSTNNFVPEPLPYGTGKKPQCELPLGEYELLSIIPSLMEKQRAEQKATNAADRVYIGGEIFALHLTGTGCSSFKVGQFRDCQQDKDYINSINKIS